MRGIQLNPTLLSNATPARYLKTFSTSAKSKHLLPLIQSCQKQTKVSACAPHEPPRNKLKNTWLFRTRRYNQSELHGIYTAKMKIMLGCNLINSGGLP